MSKYFISFLAFLLCDVVYAQDKPITLHPKDSVVYYQPYGIRAGIDLSRPITSLFDEDYTGFEVVGDYRLTYKLYIAGELGNEKRTDQEDLYNYTTSGSYIKLGVDYNTYNNWYGMNNSIFIGGRYAFSTFSQTLNDYQVFGTNRYWYPDGFPTGTTVPVPQEFTGRNASWIEAVVGTKVELFANIFIGASVRMGMLVSNKESDVFPNLWIPGFNKVTDNSSFGVGYNYSISYFLPLYKKRKKRDEKEAEKQ